MITVKVEGLDEAISGLGELKHKLPSILARTLTKTAKDAKNQVTGWLPRLLDKPTPWTMRSLFVFPAEKKETPMRAAVAFKSEFGRLPRHMMDSVEAGRSMRAQVFGGQRQLKESERTLQANGITPAGRPYLIPAIGAKRDAYGNVSGSFMNRVMFTGVRRGSASQGYHLPMNNRSESSSTRGQFFVMRKNGSAIGIFKNMGRASRPLPVFLFSARAQYRPRVPFSKIVGAEVDRMMVRRFNESVRVVAAKYLR